VLPGARGLLSRCAPRNDIELKTQIAPSLLGAICCLIHLPTDGRRCGFQAYGLLVKLSELLPRFGSVVPAGAAMLEVLVTEPVAERLI
jgi:hypothetical protein